MLGVGIYVYASGRRLDRAVANSIRPSALPSQGYSRTFPCSYGPLSSSPAGVAV